MTSLNEFELDPAARAKVGKFILDPVISHTTCSKTYKYDRINEIKLHMRHEVNFQPFRKSGCNPPPNLATMWKSSLTFIIIWNHKMCLQGRKHCYKRCSKCKRCPQNHLFVRISFQYSLSISLQAECNKNAPRNRDKDPGIISIPAASVTDQL